MCDSVVNKVFSNGHPTFYSVLITHAACSQDLRPRRLLEHFVNLNVNVKIAQCNMQLNDLLQFKAGCFCTSTEFQQFNVQYCP